ncbi:MAG TPA: polyprenyl synthetase family protein, partial [Anseongella sp.]
IELKTAVLLGASLKIGAITGGALQDDAEALFEFGKYLGITFQLQDDYLDLYGNPEKFGKQVGGDILANKKTYLIIKALELAIDEDYDLLNELMRNASVDPDEKVKRVRAIFDSLGIPGLVKTETSFFAGKAFACLDQVNIAGERKEVLREFAEKLLRREK